MVEEYSNITMGGFITREWLEPLNMSQNELARRLGISVSRINQIINNKRKISVDTDLRLCKLFGMSEGFFIRVQYSIDRREVKRKLATALDNIEPIKMVA
jgi:addiction module HigA family antidote